MQEKFREQKNKQFEETKTGNKHDIKKDNFKLKLRLHKQFRFEDVLLINLYFVPLGINTGLINFDYIH